MRLPLFLLLIFASMHSQAQSCYTRLEDASGFNTDAHQADLEAAACALRAAFPDTFQNKFKVYDFGFYLHQETFSGGYPEAFAQKITQVNANPAVPYYLLFGKQTDASGVYTRFWVEVKLPNKDVFYCIDQMSPALRGDLTAKFGIIANAAHDTNQKSPALYYYAENAAMDSLRSYVNALKACCIPPGQQQRGPSCTPCALTPSEFGQNLVNKGFSVTENQLKIAETSSTGVSSNVIGRTNLMLEVEGEAIEVDKQISGIAERYVLNNLGKTIKIYLNRYDNLCGSFDAAYNQFLNNGSDAKVFVVAVQFQNDQVKLYFYYDGELGIDAKEPLEFVKGFPDHYFDLDGNYLGKDEGNWSRIRVINKPLSQVVGLYKNEEKQLIKKIVGEPNSVNLSAHLAFVYGQGGDPNPMFSKIGGFYATQLGIYKPVVLDAGSALAWVKSPSYDKIYINKAPEFEYRDNYNQLTNAIFHENVHILTDKGKQGFPCEHADPIYLEQIKHSSFSKCPYAYWFKIVSLMGCYLSSCINESTTAGGGIENVQHIIAKLNKEVKKYQMEILVVHIGMGNYELKIKELKSSSSSKINCKNYE